MLPSLPPSTATDLAIDQLVGTQVTDAGDHLVVRSPGRPGYHWGNFLQVTGGDHAAHGVGRDVQPFGCLLQRQLMGKRGGSVHEDSSGHNSKALPRPADRGTE